MEFQVWELIGVGVLKLVAPDSHCWTGHEMTDKDWRCTELVVCVRRR